MMTGKRSMLIVFQKKNLYLNKMFTVVIIRKVMHNNDAANSHFTELNSATYKSLDYQNYHIRHRCRQIWRFIFQPFLSRLSVVQVKWLLSYGTLIALLLTNVLLINVAILSNHWAKSRIAAFIPKKTRLTLLLLWMTVSFLNNFFYHRLHESSSPVLNATSHFYGSPQNSTPHGMQTLNRLQ